MDREDTIVSISPADDLTYNTTTTAQSCERWLKVVPCCLFNACVRWQWRLFRERGGAHRPRNLSGLL